MYKRFKIQSYIQTIDTQKTNETVPVSANHDHVVAVPQLQLAAGKPTPQTQSAPGNVIRYTIAKQTSVADMVAINSF